ncbi:hypothetical protein [Euzebyella saccharophila]|uniref:Uncharacterized protein n=1 Tax=Euzebyella saccharophila TaxID=679664 RepID=A0ABV8JXD0_9FLAO|nr:hypothetical protein [Euzebyella saccharophila]
MNTLRLLPLVSWENGIWMIGIFAAVVVVLITVVWSFINGNKK